MHPSLAASACSTPWTGGKYYSLELGGRGYMSAEHKLLLVLVVECKTRFDHPSRAPQAVSSVMLAASLVHVDFQ